MTAEEYGQKEKLYFQENNIPQEFQGAISYLAYERGHAYGYDEIWDELTDLVSGLKEPIQKFSERVWKEGQENILEAQE